MAENVNEMRVGPSSVGPRSPAMFKLVVPAVEQKSNDARRFAVQVMSMLSTAAFTLYATYGEQEMPQDAVNEVASCLYEELRSFFADYGCREPDTEQVANWLMQSMKPDSGATLQQISKQIDGVYDKLMQAAIPEPCFSNQATAPTATAA